MRAGEPELAAETTKIVTLAAIAVIEARHVNVLAPNPIVVVNRTAHQFRSEAVHMKADLLCQIASDHIIRVADAIRVTFLS